ncbi:hypothetical protein [Geodermatophilus sabuli]|nr:hypothetical protein [Geodermatophilus sabuli]MBB3086859.1 hypothetical protein [Geodermatophilus sabuli]
MRAAEQHSGEEAVDEVARAVGGATDHDPGAARHPADDVVEEVTDTAAG